VNEGYYHKRKSFVRKGKFGQNGHAKALVMRQILPSQAIADVIILDI
jgi:hypothetical protein